MFTDKKKLYTVSASILVALIAVLFSPNGSGRIIAAILLLPSVITAHMLIKKRTAISINSKQILLIMSVIGFLYFVFYYVSAVHFGLTKTGYGIKPDIIFSLTLPIGAMIVLTEKLRHILVVQKDRLATASAFAICLVADIIICATIPAITTFSTFMDVVAITLFPGILYNLLYKYLSVRYGALPNIVYRLLTTWAFYLIPYGSAISDSLLGFINLLLPIAIFLFIDSLYERKRRYALGNKSRAWRIASKILTVIVLVIMIGTIMLISNQFYYGAFVIATDSMTGELNRGDVAIYESYDDQLIKEGQIIIFEHNGSVTIHRVNDIKIINGSKRYYTKGDFNEDLDAGFRTDSDIVGIVNYKLPYLGFPSLWLRSLFNH